MFDSLATKSKIKFWVVIVVIQALSFGMGVYTSENYLKSKSNLTSNLNYTTTEPAEQNQPTDNPATTTSATQPVSTTTDCKIKGNISGTSKIYHVPGGSFYDRTNPEMCFTTEAEAQAAGFTKSTR